MNVIVKTIIAVNTTMSHVLKISCRENHNYLNKEINRFKNLDAIGISPNESTVYERFENNIKFKDNRYSVNLPIKDYHPLLPDNYELSLKRLYQLRERLAKGEMILKQYDEIIQDQLEHGIIEEVKSDGVVGNVTYLPYKEVIKNQSPTTKVRIVYNASARHRNQVSLNDILYTDPCLNPKLYRFLLQFRLYPAAITADIEKAYIQINIKEEHTDCLTFLWFTNLFNDEKVKVCKYRFIRVIFGATCSQYLLNATVNKHK